MKQKMHRQYIRINHIPISLIKTSNRERYIKVCIGEKWRSLMVNEERHIHEIANGFSQAGIKTEIIKTTSAYAPSIAGQRIRKIHGDTVLALYANTQEELYSKILAAKKEMTEKKIKFDDLCQWLCVS